jgi:tRNA threonylcarbamoyl adenosine modification protein YjeE
VAAEGAKCETLELVCADLADTQKLGEALALAWKTGDLITLEGGLAAGKSALARAAIRTALGDRQADIPSPTFTLVQAYEGGHPGPIAHVDLYRLSDAGELEELGIEEVLETGVVLVEWPKLGAEVLGEPALAFKIAPEENSEIRRISVSGSRLAALRHSLEIREFLNVNKLQAALRQHLTGDASARRYEMVLAENEPLILMDSPKMPDGAVLPEHGVPYSRVAHLAESIEPFVAVAEALTTRGLTAPKFLAADYSAGFLLTTHLGIGTILSKTGAILSEPACAAAETLAFIHEQDWPDELPVGETGRTHKVPPYDARALTIETSLLPDWYVRHKTGRNLTAGERAEFCGLWGELITSLEDAEKSIVLRDVHSPNIIWRGDKSGYDRVGLIDFQDAVIGPSAYDVASLAQDARVNVSAELEAQIVDAYTAARAEGFDAEAFSHNYVVMAAQRATKIAGIFVRLCERDGKPSYLRHLPRVEDYLARNLAHPSLARYRAWWESTFGPLP